MRTSSVLPAILLGFVILLTTTTGQAAWPEDLDVSGTVVDGDGIPLQGVNVTAENTTSGIEYHAITGEGGNYSLSLPSGTYNLTGVLVNYSANNTYNMLQVDSNITDLDITMTEVMGAVTGYVTNGTVPIVGAEVFLRNDQNEYNIMSTIPLGRYDIVDVEPGTYIAYAVKDGYQTNYSDLPVVVNRGETATVNFNLKEEPATIFGNVIYGSKGVGDVKVDMTSDGFSTTTYTSDDGNYSIIGIPVGSYQITFSKEGYISQEFDVTLSPQLPEVLDVTMEKEANPGGGFIPGFDLPHSLMVLGLMFALITMVFALFIRMRIERRPEILEKEEIEEEQE